jgi:hypothetical protein
MPKGRRVPRPGERIQTKPGEYVKQLHPVVRDNLAMIAREGFKMKGRGLLMAQLNEAIASGIESAQYLSMAEIDAMNTRAGVINMPIIESVTRYDPEREFVVAVVEATRTLRNPYMWYDVVPLRDLSA